MADSDYILGGFREMTASDVQGGHAAYGGQTYDCTVGVFTLENPLLAAGGGHSPRLMGTVEIAAADFEDAPTFSTGQLIDVMDSAGTVRHCKISTWLSVGPLWQLTLVDLNQGA